MKLFTRSLAALLTSFLASSAAAQVAPGMFSNIIIIVQENRTPDNIFGAYATYPCPNNGNGGSYTLPGADIVNQPLNGGNGTSNPCNAAYTMNPGVSPTPGHQQSDWLYDYNGGSMNQFCDNTYTTPCFPYSYVVNSQYTTDVMPYYYIAANYGFANYMFQTNEGPSFEAHQFLFTGTSAPVAVNTTNDYYKYFVVNNPGNGNGTGGNSGCPQPVDLNWIDPTRSIVAGLADSYECFPHDSLVTGAAYCNNGVCDKPQIQTWKYYAPEPGSIWDAPEAIPEVCYGVNSNTQYPGKNCGWPSNSNWTSHMTFYSTENSTPIFNDIQSCSLAQITWVIPDAAWSDHPTTTSGVALGPSWVGDIVNAIGNSYANSLNNSGNNYCDYWGNVASSGSNYRKPTAIFIVWDDWGGFYDHVVPQNAWKGTGSEGSFTCGAPNSWGCGYTYGFRVPFLVVSEYTGASASGGGYISGACTSGTNCPNTTAKYQHDFGSILAFTEFNFGLPTIDQSGKNQYADINALDAVGTNIPLSDFFSLYPGTSRSFFQIPISDFPASFFGNYYSTYNATPTGPDPGLRRSQELRRQQYAMDNDCAGGGLGRRNACIRSNQN